MVVNLVTPAKRAHTSTRRSFTDIVCRWASQNRAVLSSDAATMRDPSGTLTSYKLVSNKQNLALNAEIDSM